MRQESLFKSLINASGGAEMLSEEMLQKLDHAKSPKLKEANKYFKDVIAQETTGKTTGGKIDKRIVLTEHYLKKGTDSLYKELMDTSEDNTSVQHETIWSGLLPTTMNEALWNNYISVTNSKQSAPKRGPVAQMIKSAKVIDKLIDNRTKDQERVDDQLMIAYRKSPRLVEEQLKKKGLDNQPPFSDLIEARKQLREKLSLRKQDASKAHPLVKELTTNTHMTYNYQGNKRVIPRHLVLTAFNSLSSVEYHQDSQKDFLQVVKDKKLDPKRLLLRGANPKDQKELDQLEKSIKGFQKIQKASKVSPIKLEPMEHSSGLDLALQNYDGGMDSETFNQFLKDHFDMPRETRAHLLAKLYSPSFNKQLNLFEKRGNKIFMNDVNTHNNQNTPENWDKLEDEIVSSGLASVEQVQALKTVIGPQSFNNTITELSRLFTDAEGHVNLEEALNFIKSHPILGKLGNQKSQNEISYLLLKKTIQDGRIASKSIDFAAEKLKEFSTYFNTPNNHSKHYSEEIKDSLDSILMHRRTDLAALKTITKEKPELRNKLNDPNIRGQIQRAMDRFFKATLENQPNEDFQDIYKLSKQIDNIAKDQEREQFTSVPDDLNNPEINDEEEHSIADHEEYEQSIPDESEFDRDDQSYVSLESTDSGNSLLHEDQEREQFTSVPDDLNNPEINDEEEHSIADPEEYEQSIPDESEFDRDDQSYVSLESTDSGNSLLHELDTEGVDFTQPAPEPPEEPVTLTEPPEETQPVITEAVLHPRRNSVSETAEPTQVSQEEIIERQYEMFMSKNNSSARV